MRFLLTIPFLFLTFFAPMLFAVVNGTSVTVSGTTTCNNGVTERVVAGTMTTTCGNGWWVGALGSPPPVPNFTDWLNFDSGSGTTWTGWTWDTDANQFGADGWRWTSTDLPFGPCITVSTACYPLSFQKRDYGTNTTATIDTTTRSPLKSTGGSLLLDDAANGDNQVNWWLWQDGKTLSDRNITTASIDRMSMYIKPQGFDATNTSTIAVAPLHIGTYLCWDAYCTESGKEAPNQHYYHWLFIGGSMNNSWVHILLDQHPQHQRGRVNGQPAVQVNPAYADYGKNYFENMNQMYFEVANSPQGQAVKIHLDDIRVYSTSDSPEPQQNDISIATLWVGYNPVDDWWEIGFHDRSYDTEDSTTHGTYEVRWSTIPINNTNWDNATPINALFFGDEIHTSLHAEPGVFRRASPNVGRAWTRFTLDDTVEANNNVLYFAVKDRSVAGQQAGTGFPWNSPDHQDAPSPYVKTIDYQLRAD